MAMMDMVIDPVVISCLHKVCLLVQVFTIEKEEAEWMTKELFTKQNLNYTENKLYITQKEEQHRSFKMKCFQLNQKELF